MTDYERLRALAEQATPGPWEPRGLDYSTAVDQVDTRVSIARLGDPLDSRAWCNAQFIAAANPATVLALLDENTALRRGQGRAPDACRANDRTPLHTTHPIENSQETT